MYNKTDLLSCMHTRDSCRRMFEQSESESDSFSDGSEHEGSQQSIASSLDEWDKNIHETIPSAKGGRSSAGHSHKRASIFTTCITT